MLNPFRKRVPSVRELFLQAIEEADRQAEKRRSSDLLISLSSSTSGDDQYVISVTNTGSRTYDSLRIKYEALLLDAENFGMDTTHMPSELARIPGEALVIDSLAPGHTVQTLRKGYAQHERYDGLREFPVELEYRLEGRTYLADDRRWATIIVDLPNAR
jgi:hypothetical protein